LGGAAFQSPRCGDWLRGQTEHCLFCVRGRPVVTLTNQSTVLVAPRREHSRKPDEFYRLVEVLHFLKKRLSEIKNPRGF